VGELKWDLSWASFLHKFLGAIHVGKVMGGWHRNADEVPVIEQHFSEAS
jgi:hypothetical protein